MTSTTILAIDPGNTESGWTLIDAASRRPIQIGKSDNDWLLGYCWAPPGPPARVAIEMIASYGMPVGAEVFQTCVWIGRFYEALAANDIFAELVPRQPVKLHHCHSPRAKDSNVTQALVDRFAAGQQNLGKGTAANPGWFHGFKKDIWQAYALAVYTADNHPITSEH